MTITTDELLNDAERYIQATLPDGRSYTAQLIAELYVKLRDSNCRGTNTLATTTHPTQEGGAR